MICALIGMSNVGKSYWSKRLEREAGFVRVSCDEIIAASIGIASVKALATWLGFPDSEGYADREARYLKEETNALVFALDSLRNHTGHAVIDTTGSVGSLPNGLLSRLRGQTRVIHLAIQETDFPMMLERFTCYPKPLVWNEHFDSSVGTTTEEAMKIGYSSLLASRLGTYTRLAHIEIPVQSLMNCTVNQFVYAIQQHE